LAGVNQIEKNKKFSASGTPAKRIAFAAVFTALAITLSIIESYIPIGAILPIPGIKLGLANIVTIFAIVTLRPSDTIFIILARCFVMGLFTGPVSFLFSIVGALLAFAIMELLMLGIDKIFSVIGISIAGAVAHFRILFFYLPFLMLVSIFTGAAVGVAAIPVIKNVKKAL